MSVEKQGIGACLTAPGSREPSPSVSAASGFDPSRTADAWIERFASTLQPFVSPGRLYEAARAVMLMTEWRTGIVFAEDTVETRHREFGQGYFFTPDATLFLHEEPGAVENWLRDSDGSPKGEAALAASSETTARPSPIPNSESPHG